MMAVVVMRAVIVIMVVVVIVIITDLSILYQHLPFIQIFPIFSIMRIGWEVARGKRGRVLDQLGGFL